MDNSELLTIAQEYGTPTFVFDVEEFWRRLDKVADIFDDEVRPVSYTHLTTPTRWPPSRRSTAGRTG